MQAHLSWQRSDDKDNKQDLSASWPFSPGIYILYIILVNKPHSSTPYLLPSLLNQSTKSQPTVHSHIIKQQRFCNCSIAPAFKWNLESSAAHTPTGYILWELELSKQSSAVSTKQNQINSLINNPETEFKSSLAKEHAIKILIHTSGAISDQIR